MSVAHEGDLVLLVSPDRKHYLIRLQHGGQWFSHRGSIAHDELIGQPLGRTVRTQHDYAYLALEPSTTDLIQNLPRTTQIVYGKDAAEIVLRLNLYPGRTVIEAGTGSGALTFILARAVMSTGHVYSYETRPEAFEIAQGNLADLGLTPYVTLYNEDISGGFHEQDVDALFLDLREPWFFLKHAWNALKGSGFFGALLPTTNQVSELLSALEALPFGDISVEEVLVRPWKPVPGRLRPEDRMIAHSSFLVFARKLAAGDESLRWMPEKKRRAYLGKQAMLEREAAEAAAETADE
ncbi:MAG: tRNA (adenine-N1)-methyltransferase [Chloroflexi bacterium]|nr:tRNA (adenine-N1)-methyltransferase [Chloroflexota bacterium]